MYDVIVRQEQKNLYAYASVSKVGSKGVGENRQLLEIFNEIVMKRQVILRLILPRCEWKGCRAVAMEDVMGRWKMECGEEKLEVFEWGCGGR